MRISFCGTSMASARIKLADKKRLSQEEVDKYRQVTGINDPIQPENTSRTENRALFTAKFASVVGICSASNNWVVGNWAFNSLQDKIEASQTPLLGLDKMTFLNAEQAQKYTDKENANQDGFPYRIAFHAPGSKKVLTFLTNDRNKANDIREKQQDNPFTVYNAASSTSTLPSLHLPDDADSRITGENPFASTEDDENPFKDPITRRGSWAHESQDYGFEHPQNHHRYEARDKRNADGSRTAHDTTSRISLEKSQRKPDSKHKDD